MMLRMMPHPTRSFVSFALLEKNGSMTKKIRLSKNPNWTIKKQRKWKPTTQAALAEKKLRFYSNFSILSFDFFLTPPFSEKKFIIEHFLQNLKSYFNRIFPWWWWWRLIKSYSKEQLLMCFKVVKQTRTCENASTILFCYVLISTGFSNRI